MSETKHTPGPWRIEDGMVFGGHSFRVADLCCDGQKYNAADARLIAAAPDLLEACKRLVSCPDLNLDKLSPETLKAIDDANDAICKAKGEA